MTDNGSAYRSRQWRHACGTLALRHLRSRPSTPRTNGKAERFIQTGQRAWAYARPFATSHDRTAALLPWLDHYNTARPHTALAHQPPATRLRPPRVPQFDRQDRSSVPTGPDPQPVRRGGARSTAGTRRQPARSVLAPTRRTGHA